MTTTTRPRTIGHVDLWLDCDRHGHVFGLISGNVRHCERFDCNIRDGCDPDDFVTANGDPWDDADTADHLGYCGADAYQLRQ